MQTLVAHLDALTSIGEQDSERAVLQRCVDVTAALTGAVHVAAVLVGPDGAPAATASRGTPVPEAAARWEGCMDQVLEGRLLRSAAPGRPAPLLGVPIRSSGEVVGGLCLAWASDGDVAAEAEDAVQVVSRQAARALGALHQAAGAHELLDALGTLESRSDDPPPASACETSDGADSRSGSPVVRRLLGAARTVMGMDLAFLSHIDHGQQTLTLVDAHGPAPDVVEGLSFPASDGYCAIMLEGDVHPSVPDVRAVPAMASLAVTEQAGVGAYCGVPVRLPGGELHGTLCGLHGASTTPLSSGQLQALRTIADLIGARLQQEREQDRRRLARRRSFAEYLGGARRSVVLQPISMITSGRTVGWEALSRFEDPTGAPQRPDHVFAEADRLGLGVELEQAAARTALGLLPALPRGTYLSVNLSPRALMDASTYDILSSAPLDRVVVELTEHERVPDYPALLDVLTGLRRRGLRLAVDDAGAGFASLQHITLLAPDVIKLDVAFVRGIQRAPAQRAVTRALVTFSAETACALVAEGIETAEELSQLQRLGVMHGQGYLLGRPAAPELALARATPCADAVR